jgi:hypothetical protein
MTRSCHSSWGRGDVQRPSSCDQCREDDRATRPGRGGLHNSADAALMTRLAATLPWRRLSTRPWRRCDTPWATTRRRCLGDWRRGGAARSLATRPCGRELAGDAALATRLATRLLTWTKCLLRGERRSVELVLKLLLGRRSVRQECRRRRQRHLVC